MKYRRRLTKSPSDFVLFVFKIEHSASNFWCLLYSLSKDLGVWTQRGSRVCARRRSPQTSCRTYLKIRLQRSRSDKSWGKASGNHKELWKATWNNTFTWVFLVKNALEFKSSILQWYTTYLQWMKLHIFLANIAFLVYLHASTCQVAKETHRGKAVNTFLHALVMIFTFGPIFTVAFLLLPPHGVLQPIRIQLISKSCDHPWRLSMNFHKFCLNLLYFSFKDSSSP